MALTPDPSPLTPAIEDRLRQRDRPERRPAMYQTWSSLLFAHWRVEPERIQRTLPPGLFVDTFDGAAWVGIVPFYMRNIRLPGTPALPWLSHFLELNVRTYVHDGRGTPGVWFYSLDCNRAPAVWGARTFFHLPYRRARMTAPPFGSRASTINYASQVRGSEQACRTSYRLGDVAREEVPGTFGFFLVERYVLFAADRRGRLYTGRVHHKPYPVVEASLDAWSSNLLGEHDFGVDESRPEHLCGSPGVDVEVFGLERVPQ
jgi:uncharacterized protein YqjF (DUF2071 family)